MSTKKAKGGRTRAPKNDEQEPLSDFRKGKPTPFSELEPGQDGELPTMESPRIPKLETKAKLLASARDAAKVASDKAKGTEEECLLIMADHEIETYNAHGVHLVIKRKPKLDVEIS